MEITAKVIAVLPTESGTSKSGNAWQKRMFIVETAGQYPKKICFQLFGDKVGECPAVGEEAKVSFDIESREYNGRWYTQVNAWKVERAVASQPQPQTWPAPTAQQGGWQAAYPQPSSQPMGRDDIPF